MKAKPVLDTSTHVEIDHRSVLGAVKRRWRWLIGAGLLGLFLLLGPSLLMTKKKQLSVAQVRTVLQVDVAQGPCYASMRKKADIDTRFGFIRVNCQGEVETAYLTLLKLANDAFDSNRKNSSNFMLGKPYYGVSELFLDQDLRSKTQLVLEVIGSPDQSEKILSSIANIKKKFADMQIVNALNIGATTSPGPNWLRIVKPVSYVDSVNTDVDSVNTETLSFRTVFASISGALIIGLGVALFVDRLSNRVYLKSEILRVLGYPLRLSLPSFPWSGQSVNVQVGQLASSLDTNLSWRVLSITNQHEAVIPLSDLINEFAKERLQCEVAYPLFAEILRPDKSSKSIGLLIVVESGFNSMQALAHARLLINQMTYVESVGVVMVDASLSQTMSA